MASEGFTWGDTVRLKARIDHPRAGEIAEVCGIVLIDTPEHAKCVVSGKVGETAYLVEFSDGSSLETVAELLTRV